jgi:hypothetical protein
MKNLNLKPLEDFCFNLWCIFCTFWHWLTVQVDIQEDGTIYIYYEDIVFALIPLTKDYDVDQYHTELKKDSNKKVTDEFCNRIIGSVTKYDLRLDGSYVVIPKRDGSLQLLVHSKSDGFQETNEGTWHIEDMMRFKNRNSDQYQYRIYFPVLVS